MASAWRSCAIVLLAVCSIAAASRSHARFGIAVSNLLPPVPDKLTELGVGTIRGGCDWGALEPERGRFDWYCADLVIVPAERQHLRTYFTVGCTPAWANAGAGCAGMPSDLNDWYTFVANFVTRYRKTNTVLGIWNEPNLQKFLDDDADATGYSLLFVNASNARRLIAPDFPIAGPETSHHALANGYFAAAVARIEALKAFGPRDIVAVHWYPDGPPIVAYLDQIHAIANREVWLTETGISTPDESLQARFVTDVLDAFQSSRRPWWTHVIIYRLWDGEPCCSEALLRADFTTRPAFDAYRAWLLEHPERPAIPRDGER